MSDAGLDGATGSEVSRTRRRGTRVRRERVRAAWLFLSPMIIVLGLVAGWPLLMTLWFSLTNANLSQLEQAHWVGLANYLSHEDGQWFGILADPDWWQAVTNTLLFTLVSVSLEVVFGILVALILNANFKGRLWVRAAMLIPWAIPTVVSAQMWAWMLNDQFGIVNHVLLTLGAIDEPLAFTASAHLSMLSVIMVDVWKTIPFVALLVLAAMQMLPSDCYEAARVDGISPLRVFFRVTLPLITPAVLVAIIFRVLDALRVFDLVYILTSNSSSTKTMSVYARQQLVEFQDVGYGSAASTLLYLVISLIAVVYLYLGRRQLGISA